MKSCLRIVLILAAILLIAFLWFYFAIYKKPHVDYLKAEADMEIRAEDLFNAYNTDPQAANRKYNGKVLIVAGTVDLLEETEDMNIAVMIFEDGFFGYEGVRITLLEGQEGRITVGEKMRLKGFCTGFTEADVILEHGSVVDAGY